MNVFEGIDLEYKREYTPDVKKSVVAFANTSGGTIEIGVNDNGQAVGLDNPDDTFLQVTNMIRDSIHPDITMFARATIEQKDGKNIVVIRVDKGTKAPYYLAGKGIRPEGVFVRQGASSVPATESAILHMIKENDGDDYEKGRSPVQDLTFEATQRVFEQEGVAFGARQMRTLGLINSDELYTNLALLLSDQNPHVIKAAVFEGNKKTSFKDRFEFEGSLLKQFEEVLAFLNRYNATVSHFEGVKRIDERDYHTEAIREALLNTIIHRDFSYSGPALISVFDDRIEFVTFGGLLKDITLDDLELGISILRNKNLAGIFYRLGLIEAYGTGIPKIRECYEGYPSTADIQISDNAFKLILPNIHRQQAKVDGFDMLTESEKQALELFNEQNSVLRRSVEETLNVSTSMANKILNSLREQGYIERIGQGRSARYRMVSKRMR